MGKSIWSLCSLKYCNTCFIFYCEVEPSMISYGQEHPAFSKCIYCVSFSCHVRHKATIHPKHLRVPGYLSYGAMINWDVLFYGCFVDNNAVKIKLIVI